MGTRQEAQPALFYEFSLEDHLLRSIDRFVDLSGIRTYLAGRQHLDACYGYVELGRVPHDRRRFRPGRRRHRRGLGNPGTAG